VPVLSDIEHAVLEGRANGLTNMAIAGRTKYSYRGIEDAAMRVLRKLGARDMAHAVLLACRAGILDGRPRSQRHGDHVGYTNHQKRGEEACAACKAGESAYQVERRAARKAAKAAAAQP